MIYELELADGTRGEIEIEDVIVNKLSEEEVLDLAKKAVAQASGLVVLSARRA